MKKFYSLVAVAALSTLSFAQSQETVTFKFADSGYANAQDVTTGNIISGKITFEASANGSSNTPKYYTTGTSLRLYSNNADGNGNSLAVKAVGTLKINSVKIVTDTFADYAPMSAIVTVDGVVVPTVKDPANANIYVVNTTTPASNITIKNAQTGTSAQIRIQNLEIVYTGSLGVADYSQAAQAVSNTLWANTAVFNVKEKTTVEVYNMNGQLVKSFEVNGVQNVNVSSLVKGAYVVKTTTNGKTTTQKVVKK
ncbi:T9SS type A sorting domain-containing protein [Algoriella sp.]|uniref:T9SS type A sorting domain-containing protein n=1 Tax=Algoriella sp. TaxID=1872434 RepID=UPI002FCB2100